MCFEYYTGPNKFEQALEYVEARFRAHFQQSRILARKTREVSDNPGLYKIRKDDTTEIRGMIKVALAVKKPKKMMSFRYDKYKNHQVDRCFKSKRCKSINCKQKY